MISWCMTSWYALEHECRIKIEQIRNFNLNNKILPHVNLKITQENGAHWGWFSNMLSRLIYHSYHTAMYHTISFIPYSNIWTVWYGPVRVSIPTQCTLAGMPILIFLVNLAYAMHMLRYLLLFFIFQCCSKLEAPFLKAFVQYFQNATSLMHDATWPNFGTPLFWKKKIKPFLKTS